MSGQKVSIHSCSWCDKDVEILYTTKATATYNHFCTPDCKRKFGLVVYNATLTTYNALRYVFKGGRLDPSSVRERLWKKGLLASNTGFDLTERGLRVYIAMFRRGVN